MRGSREGRAGDRGVDWGHFPRPSMIDLTENDIAEFRSLFRTETGREITDDQARAYATNLIELVAFVLRPHAEP